MRHPVHALFRVTALAVLIVLPARAMADATPDPDEAVDQITQMNRDALTAYQAKKYEDARKILKQALDLAGQAGLDKHPITARTHIHFGVVAIVGFKQRDVGIKQFKKAIEIQSDINLTKTLVTPELTEAFNEAKGATGATPPSPATPPEPPPPPKPATPPPTTSEPDVPSNGLVHEAVSEGKQGSAISVTVGVQKDLQFEKIILAYRPEGATEFLGREMKEVADGRYGAEIPTSATMGGTVAYYIEAQDANEAPVAARGSVDNPLTIRLLGVGISRHEDEDEDEEEEEGEAPDHRYFVAMLAGMGAGYATGNGDTNADVPINPAGLAGAGVGQIAPEAGYWLSPSLLLSLQLRYEYITGTTDVIAGSKTYHTANYAFAAFAKATWRFGGGDTKFHPFFSLAAGGGRIRHVVSYKHQSLVCGTNQTNPPTPVYCIDTIGAGPVLLGPGGGLMYDITDRFAAVLQVNSVLAFPDFTVHVDGNLGVAFGF